MRIPAVLGVALLIIWVLLNGTWSVGQVLVGLALSVVMLLLAASLRPVRPRLRRPHVLLALLVTVFVDVVRSNIGVARIILGMTARREVHSGFLDIPLDLRDPHALAILAAIVTSTPGTAWAGLSADGSTLTLHVLDLQDEAYWIRTIKDRYERPLLRVFE
ncbi:MAG: Na+/H+ antiporter subunit E [Steroidobacteraceae bacterium]|nr:Na+/H+ antiporter subunit E [Steroidobacteraceae bacterium]